MKIEIDQSGKIEDTSKPTVLAAACKEWSKSVKISAWDKRRLQSFFRSIGQPRLFMSKVFAALIFLAIKEDYKKISVAVIDTEYPGHEKVIRNYLRSFIVANGLNDDKISIRFKQIGKFSIAYGIAIDCLRKKKSPTIVTYKDVIGVI